MSLVSNNIKSLRKKHQYTQEQFAEKLGIKRSLLGAYEEARAKPRLEILVKAADVFGVSVDELVGKDLLQAAKAPVQAKVPAPAGNAAANSGMDKRLFKLVSKEKQPAYFAHRDDVQYMQSLPDMLLPMFQEADSTYRAFEITEDAMLPVAPGTIVVARKEENLQVVRSGQVYMVITREGFMLRTVYNQVATSGTLRLQAANPAYQDTVLSLLGKEVEIWEVVTYISQQAPFHTAAPAWTDASRHSMNLQQLTALVLELQQEIEKIKRN